MTAHLHSPDAAPSGWIPLPGRIPGFGLPEERLESRLAARRAFVELKRAFMSASADVEGRQGELLRRKARHATEAIDRYRLRHIMLDALSDAHPRTPMHRAQLQLHIEQVFPQEGPEAAFAPLFGLQPYLSEPK